MIDLKSLLLEEKALGKNPYYSYKVSTLEEINSEILQIKKVEAKESLRQDAIMMEYDNVDSILLTFVAGRINLLMNPHEAQIRLNNLMNMFHEKRNYPALHDFIRSVIVPEMQIKLKQGFGRAIRTETDTCVVAILDERCSARGRYRQDVLNALPEMPILTEVSDIRRFLYTVKPRSYFEAAA